MDSLLMVLAAETLNLACFACLQRCMVARLAATEHQLQVYKRQVEQPRLKDRDRLLWVLLSKIWKGWRRSLVIVQPETVFRWQKRRLRDWWRRRLQPGPGRPLIRREHIDLIRLISRDHPEYGEDYVANELEKKFGIKHSTATVRKYMVKSKGEGDSKGSQSWATFVRSQAAAIWTCDFLVAHTVGLRAIYVFVVMELSTRKVVHFNVTENPTLPWIKQQIRNVCFDHDPPRFLVHDNDGKFGQFGEVRRVERDGKKVSCRSAGWKSADHGSNAIP